MLIQLLKDLFLFLSQISFWIGLILGCVLAKPVGKALNWVWDWIVYGITYLWNKIFKKKT